MGLQLTIRLPKSINERLRRVAADEHLPMATMIRKIVLDHLDK